MSELTFVFKDNTEVEIPFPLNSQQVEALLELENFYHNSQAYDNQITLQGYAGTGKTSIIGIFDSFLRVHHTIPWYSSPTHRANAVTKLKNPRAKVLTLHSLFGLTGSFKIEDGDYDIKDLQFAQRGKVRIGYGDFLIVDESSMVNDALEGFLETYRTQYNIRIVYVGDRGQLKPPKQKHLSKVFDKGRQLQLTKVERTGDNAILLESTRLRSDQDFTYTTSVNEQGMGVEYVGASTGLSKIIARNFGEEFKKNKLFFRILPAKNDTVAAYNNFARAVLFKTKDQLHVGELLMGYSNFDVDYETKEPRIINGGDYEVMQMSDLTTKSIRIEDGTIEFKGWQVVLKNLLIRNPYPIHVFIASKEESPEKLTQFADAISALNVKGAAFMKEGDRQAGATCFAAARDLEASIAFMHNLKSSKGRDKVRKTLDYGYSHTTHKSQGGTYNRVLIIADDFEGGFDLQTKQQLKYVAMSRASEYVYVKSCFYKEEPTQSDELEDEEE